MFRVLSIENEVLMSNDLPGVAVPTLPFDGISHMTCARAPPPSLRGNTTIVLLVIKLLA